MHVGILYYFALCYNNFISHESSGIVLGIQTFFVVVVLCVVLYCTIKLIVGISIIN
jgi:hypothetical protein